MYQRYRIESHILTIKKLWDRTHDGEFRGLERLLMIAIMWLKLCFPSFWIRHYADVRWNNLKSRLMEYYVLAATAITMLILLSGRWSHWTWLVITIYTFAELVVYLLWLILLGKINHRQPNIRRNLILLGMNTIEIIAAFAIFYLNSNSLYYANSGELVQSGAEAFYFSIATFATVGYGDMVTHWHMGHFIATCQILTSFLFITLVLSSVVSKIEITSEW